MKMTTHTDEKRLKTEDETFGWHAYKKTHVLNKKIVNFLVTLDKNNVRGIFVVNDSILENT